MREKGNLDHFFEEVLRQKLQPTVKLLGFSPVGGGCISQAMKLETSHGNFFIKWQDESNLALFEAEVDGLKRLEDSGAVCVPRVLGIGQIDQQAFILMAYLVPGRAVRSYWEDLGTSLAKLHRNSGVTFGLIKDNFIGSLPQLNQPSENWLTFFINQRLEVQLKLALENSLIDLAFLKKFRSIYPLFNGIFPNESPSLLHGDLWSGNVIIGPEGKACLIDPAVYYGNREAEIAFTKLFGGFELGFYQSYHQSFPLQPDFKTREGIYNLYPLLVHVNLFGTSYLPGIKQIIHRFQTGG
ncbi:fructosamine kinase family protein [Xanthovirga aplysinae]|uniref:fructosamine kinase family protein n=1 Tax=Xanthovirga aplysinae TaxID=2529853 RepID=UPI0012BC9EE1|nr:fructosamine kinase family protein [Xanthovirga aplysinae]MTI30390.1 ketosamine-3-kinase [Xanthovirga aplysinae]